jgi:hypothetical protein
MGAAYTTLVSILHLSNMCEYEYKLWNCWLFNFFHPPVTSTHFVHLDFSATFNLQGLETNTCFVFYNIYKLHKMKYRKLHYKIAEGIATGENVTVQVHSCRGGTECPSKYCYDLSCSYTWV